MDVIPLGEGGVMAKVTRTENGMSGDLCIDGTRVPVEGIVADLRRIYGARPTLPEGSIEAAIEWARETYGPDWWRTDKRRQHDGDDDRPVEGTPRADGGLEAEADPVVRAVVAASAPDLIYELPVSLINPIEPEARRFLLVVGVAEAEWPTPEISLFPITRRRFEDGAPYFNSMTGIARNQGRLIYWRGEAP